MRVPPSKVGDGNEEPNNVLQRTAIQRRLAHHWRYMINTIQNWRFWIVDYIGCWFRNVYEWSFLLVIAGYILGRWAPVYLRIVVVFLITVAGTCWVSYSQHHLEVYTWTNVLYALSVIAGLVHKSRKQELSIFHVRHYDWCMVLVVTLLVSWGYHPPAM